MCMDRVGRGSWLILRIVVPCYTIIMVRSGLPLAFIGGEPTGLVRGYVLTIIVTADTSVGLGDGDYLFGFNKISWSTGWPVLV